MHVQTGTLSILLIAPTDLLLLEGLESLLEARGEDKVTPPGQKGQFPPQVRVPA